MKINAYLKIAVLVALSLNATSALADINSTGLFDTVLQRYADKASTWATVITHHATWMYWVLVSISMVWTFGFMALRRADLGEFFAEFIRFTIVTGFFWWLLINGPAYATGLIQSMRTMAGNATGLGGTLAPSGIVDIGFDIYNKVLDKSTLWSPVDSAIGIIIALIILVILALIGVNMLLLIISGWILAYAGIFYLGFGGSRWTSDIAINYYKTVLGIAMQLFTMVLLVGIGSSVLNEYYVNMSAGVMFGEMAVVLVVAVILLTLVNKVPPLIAGVITGSSVGGMGIGQFGAGAALGAAATAGAAAAVGGAMIAAGAMQASGGAQAVMSAISKAQENVAAGTDIMSGMSSSGTSSGSGSSSGSAFAQAAGFAGESTSVAKATSLSSDSPDSGGHTESAQASDNAPAPASKGVFGAALAKAGRIAADASANLARGTADLATNKANSVKEAAQQRISETIGGQIATAIQTHNAGFGENSLSGAPTASHDDLAAEIESFSEKDSIKS